VRSIEEIKAKQAEDLDVIDDIAKQLEAGLARYEPERLTTFTTANVVYSEMLASMDF